jgi:ABC-type transport system involved in multi-copper enzyme maturation permease subunit
LFVAIWVLVPLLAADCISRERRDGTLGLLFLTPLKARDIVVAKGLVHGLRALTLLLAVLPIMMIPILQGGVGWREVAMSGLINFTSVCLALAAGILASSFSRKWLQAQILATLLGMTFGVMFLLVTAYFAASFSGISRISGTGLVYNGTYYETGGTFNAMLVVGVGAATGTGGQWASALAAMGKLNRPHWLEAEGAIAAAGLCVLLLAIEFASWRVRSLWQEEPLSGRALKIQQALVTPVVGVKFLRRWMKRKLLRNPIGWLEQRTWSGRLVTWSWLAVMVSLYSAMFAGTVTYRAIYNLQEFMAWLLLAGVASSAAGSFQRERETGVMELLLVSPMREGQIIGGRLRGLWGQFLPAVILLFSVWLYFRGIRPMMVKYDWLAIFCAGFLTLPVIGLYNSLRQRSFVPAFLLTLGMGLALPLVVRSIVAFSLNILVERGPYYSQVAGQTLSLWDKVWIDFQSWLLWFVSTSYFVAALQVLMAVYLGWRLHKDMARRNFSFARVMT